MSQWIDPIYISAVLGLLGGLLRALFSGKEYIRYALSGAITSIGCMLYLMDIEVTQSRRYFYVLLVGFAAKDIVMLLKLRVKGITSINHEVIKDVSDSVRGAFK